MIRQVATSASRAIARSSTPKNAPFIQTRLASGGGASYNQPTGRLFGEKPLPKGQKRVKEDWETIYYFGMFGTLAFGGLIYAFKPDTSIQTWAMAEARKRLEASGDDWKYKPSPNSGHPNGV
ncbi:hypothetical protein ACQY0O_000584 [Thecaphora frezii]